MVNISVFATVANIRCIATVANISHSRLTTLVAAASMYICDEER